MTNPSEPAGPSDDWRKIRLRAPREAGSVFARPEVGQARGLMERNVEQFRDTSEQVVLCGRSLDRLRHEARREVVSLARRYTTRLRGGLPTNVGDGPLIATGHQPVWFHPGVWAKNFATEALARSVGGTAINFIVDHDTRGSTAVWVPRGTRSQPTRESVAYDVMQPARPWEEVRGVADRGLLTSFGDRLVERMADWKIEPVVADVWPGIVERVSQGERLVEAFAAARVRCEADWGAGTLELPTSELAGTEAFAWFVSHLLSDLPSLHETYNRTVRRYRQVNGVRNDRHPVPELGSKDGGWLEAPLWVWKAGSTKRGRLFARREGNTILLSDEQGSLPELKFADNGEACCASRELTTWPAKGLRLRPRALTMTMFTRVFLADLFVHGIGGAKYDEITDRLIAARYGIPVPGYLTLTSTEPLPLGAWNCVPEDWARVKQQLRDLEFNAERHLSEGALADPEIASLVEEKRRLQDEQNEVNAARFAGTKPAKGRGAKRFRRLREIHSQLGSLLTKERQRFVAELETVQAELRANKVLANREYAWLLFPQERLQKAMRRVGEMFGE